MHTSTHRGFIAAAALLALLLGGATARAAITSALSSPTGSTCSGAGSTDGDCRFSSLKTTDTGTTLTSRYAWNINADVSAGSTHDSSSSARHNLTFNASATGGYRLDITTTRMGDINRISDVVNCDGSADTSGVTGSSNVALSSGTISLGDPGGIGNGGGDLEQVINQGPTSATIFRVSNGVALSHALTFTWSGAVRSNSCEAAVRQGESSGTTSGCGACGYPGTPGRTSTTDGHFVTVTFTSLCGNGTVDGAAGEQCDLGGSNGSGSTCCTSLCQFRAAPQVCRTGGGAPCDVSEACTGTSASCPTDDAPGNFGVLCRVGSGDTCDPDEVCNGSPGAGCPVNVVTPAGTTCRTGSGDICDPAETCSGIAGQACPANVVNGPSTVCRTGSGDACDTNETCSGIAGATCPPDDAPLNAGDVCRAGSGDVCDQNELCPGTPGATCPPDDAPTNGSVVCRPSSVAGSFCDEDELCPGVVGGVCPPNDAPGKVNMVCRTGSGDQCDPDERCTGISGQGCPQDVVAPPSTVCRAGSGDSCDPAEHCTAVPAAPCPANVVSPAGTTCRAAAGACDVAEQCSGTALQPCPANGFAPNGTSCNADSNLCTVDKCNSSGGCVFSNPLDCNDGITCTTDTCDPQNGCASSGTPSNLCLSAVTASLQIKDRDDPRDRLKFKWKGGPVLVNDLGNPTQTTTYELCIYDNTNVRLPMSVAPGTGWKISGPVSAPRGYKYRDRFAQQTGIYGIGLKASSVNRARLSVKGKGGMLPDTTLGFTLPVTAQLHNSTGECWSAEFGPAETRRNDTLYFNAKKRAP